MNVAESLDLVADAIHDLASAIRTTDRPVSNDTKSNSEYLDKCDYVLDNAWPKFDTKYIEMIKNLILDKKELSEKQKKSVNNIYNTIKERVS